MVDELGGGEWASMAFTHGLGGNRPKGEAGRCLSLDPNGAGDPHHPSFGIPLQ